MPELPSAESRWFYVDKRPLCFTVVKVPAFVRDAAALLDEEAAFRHVQSPETLLDAVRELPRARRALSLRRVVAFRDEFLFAEELLGREASIPESEITKLGLQHLGFGASPELQTKTIAEISESCQRFRWILLASAGAGLGPMIWGDGDMVACAGTLVMGTAVYLIAVATEPLGKVALTKVVLLLAASEEEPDKAHKE